MSDGVAWPAHIKILRGEKAKRIQTGVDEFAKHVSPKDHPRPTIGDLSFEAWAAMNDEIAEIAEKGKFRSLVLVQYCRELPGAPPQVHFWTDAWTTNAGVARPEWLRYHVGRHLGAGNVGNKEKGKAQLQLTRNSTDPAKEGLV